MGKKSTANFAVYMLLFENYICPFRKKLASPNSMQKKDDKVGNKTRQSMIKKEKKERKRVREKDRSRFERKIQIWLLPLA